MGSHLSKDIYLKHGTKHHLIVSISCDSLAYCPGVTFCGANADADDGDVYADADDAYADYGDDDNCSCSRIFPSVFSTFATFVVSSSSLSSGLSGKARRKIFLNSFNWKNIKICKFDNVYVLIAVNISI